MGSRRVNANQRLHWTDELHQRFADAVAQLGGRDGAKPKAILGLMGEPAVTLNHVKSHLQKHRIAASIPDSSSSLSRKANRKVPAAKRKEPAAKRKEPVVKRKELMVKIKEPTAKRKEPAVKRKEPAASSSDGRRARKTITRKEAVEDTRSDADLAFGALKLRLDEQLEARRQLNVQLGELTDTLKNVVDEALQSDF